MKREHGRGGESGQDHHGFARLARQADRLAGLERHAVGHDSRLGGARPIGQVAGPLAGAAETAVPGRPSPGPRRQRLRAAVASSRTMPSSRGSPPSSRTASARIGRVGIVDQPGAQGSPGGMISSPVERIATRGRRTTATSPPPNGREHAGFPARSIACRDAGPAPPRAISVPAKLTLPPGAIGLVTIEPVRLDPRVLDHQDRVRPAGERAAPGGNHRRPFRVGRQQRARYPVAISSVLTRRPACSVFRSPVRLLGPGGQSRRR